MTEKESISSGIRMPETRRGGTIVPGTPMSAPSAKSGDGLSTVFPPRLVDECTVLRCWVVSRMAIASGWLSSLRAGTDSLMEVLEGLDVESLDVPQLKELRTLVSQVEDRARASACFRKDFAGSVVSLARFRGCVRERGDEERRPGVSPGETRGTVVRSTYSAAAALPPVRLGPDVGRGGLSGDDGEEFMSPRPLPPSTPETGSRGFGGVGEGIGGGVGQESGETGSGEDSGKRDLKRSVKGRKCDVVVRDRVVVAKEDVNRKMIIQEAVRKEGGRSGCREDYAKKEELKRKSRTKVDTCDRLGVSKEDVDSKVIAKEDVCKETGRSGSGDCVKREEVRGKRRRKVDLLGYRGREKPAAVSVAVSRSTGLAEDIRRARLYGAMAKARRIISVEELGDRGVRVRHARSGGLLLEFPGSEGHTRADRVCSLLRDGFRDEGGGVIISRPRRVGEFALRGCDPSVPPEETRMVLSRLGGCDPAAVTVRRLVRGSPGVVLVRCPMDIGRRIVNAGRVRIGWGFARLEFLRERLPRCCRCSGVGHLLWQCPHPVDRPRRCFRCGGVGHERLACGRVERDKAMDLVTMVEKRRGPGDPVVQGSASGSILREEGFVTPVTGRKRGGPTKGALPCSKVEDPAKKVLAPKNGRIGAPPSKEGVISMRETAPAVGGLSPPTRVARRGRSSLSTGWKAVRTWDDITDLFIPPLSGHSSKAGDATPSAGNCGG